MIRINYSQPTHTIRRCFRSTHSTLLNIIIHFKCPNRFLSTMKLSFNIYSEFYAQICMLQVVYLLISLLLCFKLYAMCTLHMPATIQPQLNSRNHQIQQIQKSTESCSREMTLTIMIQFTLRHNEVSTGPRVDRSYIQS